MIAWMSKRFPLWFQIMLVCTFGIVGSSAQTQPTSAPSMVEYQSKTHGFSFSYPDQFKQMAENQQGLALMLMRKTPDKNGTNANVIIAVPDGFQGTKTKPLDLDESYRAYLEMLKGSLKEPKVADQGDTTLAGEPAKFVILAGNQLDVDRPTKIKMIAAVHDNRLFSVIGMSEPNGFDSLKESFDKMMESMKWNKK